MTVPIAVPYLRHLAAPVEKLTCEYATSNSTDTNHALRNCNYPRLDMLTVRANVMLIRNYAVKLFMTNRSVGTITHIIYEKQEGPR